MLRIAGTLLAVGLCVAGCTAATIDDATVRRLTKEGVNPDLLYFAKVPGFTAVEKSMGPTGDGGFRITYVSDSDPADRAEFRVYPTDSAQVLCASTPTPIPIPNADRAAPIECVDKGKGLYRSSNGFHEYIQGYMRLSAPIDALSYDNLHATLNNSVSSRDDGPGVVDVVP